MESDKMGQAIIPYCRTCTGKTKFQVSHSFPATNNYKSYTTALYKCLDDSCNSITVVKVTTGE